MGRAEEAFEISRDQPESMGGIEACQEDLRPFFDWAYMPDIRQRSMATRHVLRVVSAVWERLGAFGEMDARQQSAALAALLAAHDVTRTGLVVALAARAFPAVRAAFEGLAGFGAWLDAYALPQPGVLAVEFAAARIDEESAMHDDASDDDGPKKVSTWLRLRDLGAFATAVADYAGSCMRAQWADNVRHRILDPIDAQLQKGQAIDPTIRGALIQARDAAMGAHTWIASETAMSKPESDRIQLSLRWADRLVHACVPAQDRVDAMHRQIQRLAQDPIAKAAELRAAIEAMQGHDPSQSLQAFLDQRPPKLDFAPQQPQADQRQTMPEDGLGQASAGQDDLERAVEALKIEREKNQRAGEHITALQSSIRDLESRLATPVVASKDSILAAMQDPLTPEIALAVAVASRPLLRALPSARDSARKSASFRHGRKLLELLLDLGDGYAQALRSGLPDAVARGALGGAYRAKESDAAMSSKTCRQARTFIVDGRPILMEQHLAIGIASSPVETLRVHFAWIDGRIVIGHCGEHLPLLATA